MTLIWIRGNRKVAMGLLIHQHKACKKGPAANLLSILLHRGPRIPGFWPFPRHAMLRYQNSLKHASIPVIKKGTNNHYCISSSISCFACINFEDPFRESSLRLPPAFNAATPAVSEDSPPLAMISVAVLPGVPAPTAL